ncbi:protein of unknown function [Tenacibaculum sp. MAR_2010_89]|uniref:DUF4270 family protein n=1 Tax=Tenacibaculum sp. MAR_2010_89 TaxID=1250198 RepID=UPI000899D771|nr:DUF4270 family protein [Tenacibaculum sp. MAR_2010_89]SED95374.1 protein of unknown function [Tenacibaculum sp. MAR_2010_89]
MVRKIGILGVSLLCLASIISCEKDLNDIGTGIVKNTKFNTNQIDLELEITPVDLEVDSNGNPSAIRADNINTAVSEYWLGVYNSKDYKTVESSFISQLGFVTDLKTLDTNPVAKDGDIDSVFILDKVILKLPYRATSKGKESDGKPKFHLDSVLGDPTIATSLKIIKNGTFLNTFDPTNPSKNNSFLSNHTYIEDEVLNEDPNFSFKPNTRDTMYVFTRSTSTGVTFKDTIKLSNKAPFITVPLKMNRMKELFWDKFNDSEFSSSQALNEYFRGIYAKVEGSNGSMVPLSLLGTSESASLEFYYTITRFEKKEGITNSVYKDTVPTKFSFPLAGVRNSKYKMSAATNSIPSNNFVIQGTTGSMANVKVLGVNLGKLKLNDPNNTILKHEAKDNNGDGYLDLKELSNIKDLANDQYGLLVNDAVLSFYINQTVNTDKNILPQKLHLYLNKDNGSGGITPTQISDTYKESNTYGGNLILSDDKPERYTFRITDYVASLFDKTSTDFAPLVLKVYNNPTDASLKNRAIDLNVESYNWNPRGVTILDENEAANGTKRAVLKISYSEKK